MEGRGGARGEGAEPRGSRGLPQSLRLRRARALLPPTVPMTGRQARPIPPSARRTTTSLPVSRRSLAAQSVWGHAASNVQSDAPSLSLSVAHERGIAEPQAPAFVKHFCLSQCCRPASNRGPSVGQPESQPAAIVIAIAIAIVKAIVIAITNSYYE